MGKSGRGLGILALIIAIGTLGFVMYQFFFPTPSNEPEIYVVTHENPVYLDSSGVGEIPQLNITYNTNLGDKVLIEFSCQIVLAPIGPGTTIILSFDLDVGSASSEIMIWGDTPEYCSGIMRHFNQSTSPGEHYVGIQTYIDDDSTLSYVRYSILTVTVY